MVMSAFERMKRGTAGTQVPGEPVEAGREVPTSDAGRGMGSQGLGAPPADPVEAPAETTPETLQSELQERGTQFGAQGPTGAGTTGLGGFARGELGLAQQAERDKMFQGMSGLQHGVRGSQNVGLALRGTQKAQTDLAAKQTAQAGALQMTAAQAAATIEVKTFEINKKVEADLQMQRDALIQKYEEMDMSEEQYLAELEAAMDRLKKQLTFDYWNSDVEAQTALDVTHMQEKDWVGGGNTGVPGFNEEGEFQDSFWFTPEGKEVLAKKEAEQNTETNDPYSPHPSISQEQWNQMTDDQKASLRRTWNMPLEDTGGPEDEEGVLGLPSLKEGFVGPPTLREQVGGEVDDTLVKKSAGEIQTEASQKTDDEINQHLRYMQNIKRGVGLGASAYQFGTAKNKKERTAAALGFAKSELGREAASMLADKIGSTPAGALINATTAAATEAADPNKRVPQGERVAYAAGESGAASLGAYLGGAAGTAAAGLGGPATVALAPYASAAASAGGAALGSAAFKALAPEPTFRTTNPQELIARGMGGVGPEQLASDPMAIMRASPGRANQLPFEDQFPRRETRPSGRTSDVGDRSIYDTGGPEDAAMPLPENDAYSYLEGIGSGGPEALPPTGGGAPESPAMSAIGDLHERLRAIEELLGTSPEGAL